MVALYCPGFHSSSAGRVHELLELSLLLLPTDRRCWFIERFRVVGVPVSGRANVLLQRQTRVVACASNACARVCECACVSVCARTEQCRIKGVLVGLFPFLHQPSLWPPPSPLIEFTNFFPHTFFRRFQLPCDRELRAHLIREYERDNQILFD